MTLSEFLNMVAILLGPVTAVCITLWVQRRTEKRTLKRSIFTTLLAHRKSILITESVANSLNLIDVIFHDNRQVCELWHDYYALLSQNPSEARTHKWLELLTSMAKDLGYNNLTQVDLDKFYIPQAHVDQIDFQREVSGEWLRVLKNTEKFLVERRTEGKLIASK